jgi:hypothetical protein
MADVPQRSQPPQKSSSLAAMAAKAAQRSASSRPPPVSYVPPASSAARPASAPPPSSFSGFNGSSESGSAAGDGSGLIHLQRMQATSSLTPATRALDSRRLAPPAVRTELDSNPYEKKGRSRVLLTALVIVVLGIGALYGVAAKRGTTPIALTKSIISSLKGGSDSVGSSQFSVKDEAPAKIGSPTADQPAGPKGIAPGNLPAAGAIAPSEATDVVGDNKAHAARATRPAEKAAPVTVAAVAPAPKTEAPAPQAAAPAPQAAADPPGLAGAIKKAVGPQQPAAAAADTAAPAAPAVRGDIPEAPPQGAIQGALGSQRGAARSCVAGHDAPSRATIVFASTGKVQSVSVSGPAAGTAAEGCIKSVLSKANVGPFQRSSFSVSTTISPP